LYQPLFCKHASLASLLQRAQIKDKPSPCSLLLSVFFLKLSLFLKTEGIPQQLKDMLKLLVWLASTMPARAILMSSGLLSIMPARAILMSSGSSARALQPTVLSAQLHAEQRVGYTPPAALDDDGHRVDLHVLDDLIRSGNLRVINRKPKYTERRR
jgi:hypothetical protein